MSLEFKEGSGWKCCYDPESGLYTAQTGSMGNQDLYEITKEIYDHVDDPDVEWPELLIGEGRLLFKAVDDRCGPPYTVVFDDEYETLCPWAKPMKSGRVWSEELTDAAAELFASEQDNRRQRREKREKRNGSRSEDK